MPAFMTSWPIAPSWASRVYLRRFTVAWDTAGCYSTHLRNYQLVRNVFGQWVETIAEIKKSKSHACFEESKHNAASSHPTGLWARVFHMSHAWSNQPFLWAWPRQIRLRAREKPPSGSGQSLLLYKCRRKVQPGWHRWPSAGLVRWNHTSPLQPHLVQRSDLWFYGICNERAARLLQVNPGTTKRRCRCCLSPVPRGQPGRYGGLRTPSSCLLKQFTRLLFLPTQAEVQFLSSRPLGKFAVETDTLLKVLLRAGVTAGRARSEDYSEAARHAHCPLEHEWMG